MIRFRLGLTVVPFAGVACVVDSVGRFRGCLVGAVLWPVAVVGVAVFGDSGGDGGVCRFDALFDAGTAGLEVSVAV